MISERSIALDIVATFEDNSGVPLILSGVPILNLYGVTNELDHVFIGSYNMVNISGSLYRSLINLSSTKSFDYYVAKYKAYLQNQQSELTDEETYYPNKTKQLNEYAKVWNELTDIKRNLAELKYGDDRHRIASILSEVDDMRKSFEEFQNSLLKIIPTSMLKRGMK